jgi:deoxyuridine 5'-triphosphate nucleotidohydrolase
MVLYTNYFKSIDTNEKSYILGLVCKNNNFIMSLSHNNYIKMLLSSFCEDIENSLNVKITNDDILNDIKVAISKFKDFSEEFKIAFIRGFYEANYDDIILIDNIKLIIDDIKISILQDIEYDIINDGTYEHIMIGKNYYKNKFLNKLYKNATITLLTPFIKSKILYDIEIKKPNIKVYKTDPNAIIPTKAFEEDAGYDLTIIKKIKDFNSKTVLYDTGIKIEIDEGYYTEIVPRSSISKFGYILANNIGIIDNHYRGNLMIALTKIADDAPEIELPFKCCQLLVREQILSNLYEITDNNLTSTKRQDGGFGSTS